MYKIILFALGQDVEQDELVTVNRNAHSTARLEYNLASLWAWNIRGTNGYTADGPAVFIEFCD